jgi:hypothetical protein
MKLKHRYTVIEAASALGVGTDAVRKRVARGTIEHERTDGTVYVWLDDGHDDGTTDWHDDDANGDDSELLHAFRNQLDTYKDQVVFLRSSLEQEREARRRADTIIVQLTQANAALAQRVPELEAPTSPEQPREARGSPVGSADVEGSYASPDAPPDQQQPPQRRSWWREFFGFE